MCRNVIVEASLIALDWDPSNDVNAWSDPDRVTHIWKAGNPVNAPSR